MSSRESTEQGRSGRRGAEASRTEGAGGQPRQGANRTEPYAAEEEQKHHFEPGQRPSEQGEEGSPSPDTVRRHQQGYSGTGTGQSGSHAGGSGHTGPPARADDRDAGR